ncbi:unnamed protein product, partial [Ectocarpus sp. 13 AM-2016]
MDTRDLAATTCIACACTRQPCNSNQYPGVCVLHSRFSAVVVFFSRWATVDQAARKGTPRGVVCHRHEHGFAVLGMSLLMKQTRRTAGAVPGHGDPYPCGPRRE